MIIIDNLLKRRAAEGRPVLVGMSGAGVQGKAITRTIERSTPGMRMAAIANRSIDNAFRAFDEVGVTPIRCDTPEAAEIAIVKGHCVILPDPAMLVQIRCLDAFIEATGSLEYAAKSVLEAIDAGKHIVQVNAELDGTVGPILKIKADAKGVIYTAADGDQPGAQMNLVRFIEGIGLKAVLCGNIKGLFDPYRTPTTQASFAEKWNLNPAMVTSFADGTKISFEQAVIANGLGMKVVKRGMVGPDFSNGNPYNPLVPLSETISAFTQYLDRLGDGVGYVDYVMGASPGPGIFVLAKLVEEDIHQAHFLNYYKMGSGPYYCFYTPYHLCHFEVPGSVARAVLLSDATLAPKGGPSVGVVTLAKKDLEPGETIKELGGYEVYGMLENIEIIRKEKLVPLGLAIGARVNKPIKRDQPLCLSDLDRPAGRVIDDLYAEQEKLFDLVG